MNLTMEARPRGSRTRVRMLCEGALLVAAAQILSYVKFLELPNGGSLTPAMFPIILFAVRWGTAPGLMAGFVFGLLQLIFDGAYAWGWQSMLLDYLAALYPPWDWPACSRAGPGASLPARWWAAPGGSWSTTSAGVTIYKILVPTAFMNWTFTSPSFYSIVYNGSYMLPNTVIALAIAALLYKPMKRYILGQDIQ